MKEKKLCERYRAYVVDMDGTLYFQTPVRVAMLCELLRYYICHPLRIRELFAIKKYREIREKRLYAEYDDHEEKQINYVSKKYLMTADDFRNVKNKWMQKVPLEYIKQNRNNELIEFLNRQKTNGALIIVYSDYPVKEKLDAIGFQPDAYYSASDPEIGCMKPDPKGLKNIMSIHGLKAEETLFIGDRQEKDGECAMSCGVNYIIIGKTGRGVTGY